MAFGVVFNRGSQPWQHECPALASAPRVRPSLSGVGWGWGEIAHWRPLGVQLSDGITTPLRDTRKLVLHAFTQDPQDCPALVDFYDVPMEAGR